VGSAADATPPIGDVIDRAQRLANWHHFWFPKPGGNSGQRLQLLIVQPHSGKRVIALFPTLGVWFEIDVRPGAQNAIITVHRIETASSSEALEELYQYERLRESLQGSADRFSRRPDDGDYITSNASATISVHTISVDVFKPPKEIVLTSSGRALVTHVTSYALRVTKGCGPARYIVPLFSDIDPEVYVRVEFAGTKCRNGIVRCYLAPTGEWLDDKLITPASADWAKTIYAMIPSYAWLVFRTTDEAR
jgi:hypothetical protein